MSADALAPSMASVRSGDYRAYSSIAANPASSVETGHARR